MNRLPKILCWTLLLCVGAVPAHAEGDSEETPSWTIPAGDTVRQQLVAWLDDQEISTSVRAKALATWDELAVAIPLDDTLTRWMQSIAAVDPSAADLIATCSSASRIGLLPTITWLDDPTVASVIQLNSQLFYGRWLAQEGYFDEAIETLAKIKPHEVVDPAALLFYRSVAHHRLVDVEAGTEELAILLERRDELPVRYEQLATLMAQDLAHVEDDSLDHIARRMSDIKRRLTKGRAGAKVIEIEEGVLESLDKKIKKLEDEEKRRQQQMQPGSGQGATPMEDSRPARLKAPGRVDRRKIGSRAGWGDLPDKDREKALQQIGRDFPAHYRDVIEQYFRKLAAEEE